MIQKDHVTLKTGVKMLKIHYILKQFHMHHSQINIYVYTSFSIPYHFGAHTKPVERVPSGGPPAPPQHSPPRQDEAGQTEGQTHTHTTVGKAVTKMLEILIIICVMTEMFPLLTSSRAPVDSLWPATLMTSSDRDMMYKKPSSSTKPASMVS